MQFFILFVGAMVFVFYIFERPPLLFERPAMQRLEAAGGYLQVKTRYDRAFEARPRRTRPMSPPGSLSELPKRSRAICSIQTLV